MAVWSESERAYVPDAESPGGRSSIPIKRKQRAVCLPCDRSRPLRKDGRFALHDYSNTLRVRCPGSGLTPEEAQFVRREGGHDHDHDS